MIIECTDEQWKAIMGIRIMCEPVVGMDKAECFIAKVGEEAMAKQAEKIERSKGRR